MIKIDTGKGKILSFDIDIEGGSDSEIKEGRFIISCPNKTYKLMFEALIEDGNVSVDLPPLDINEKSGECSLEMISTDNQYYPVWKDKVKFDRSLTIKVKEQKEIEKKPVVTLNEGEKKTNIIKEKKIVKSLKTRKVYRTIKCDLDTLTEVLEKRKFSMKPKAGVKVKFYENDTMLINDLENTDCGICVGLCVPVNGILEERKDQTLIVDSSYLDKINEHNVMFVIRNGQLIQLRKEDIIN